MTYGRSAAKSPMYGQFLSQIIRETQIFLTCCFPRPMINEIWNNEMIKKENKEHGTE